MRYAILEKTPFPGYWQHAPVYRLQEAEFHCFKGDSGYHIRAINLSKYPERTLIYQLWDAEMLLEYLKATCDFAEYQLMGVVIRDET